MCLDCIVTVEHKILYFEERWEPNSCWKALTSIVKKKYYRRQWGPETVWLFFKILSFVSAEEITIPLTFFKSEYCGEKPSKRTIIYKSYPQGSLLEESVTEA